MVCHSKLLAFKKSELLAVILAIDESFSFDTVVSSQPIQEQVGELFNNIIQSNGDIESYWADPIEPDYEAWEEIDKYLLEEHAVKNFSAQSNKVDLGDYKTLLFKKPSLSTYESASIVSEINPSLIMACNDEYDSRITYPNWGGALDYIKTCVKEGLLNAEGSTRDHIKRDDLKKFLASEDIIIEGFNDNLPIQGSTSFGQPSIQQIDPNIENLNAEIIQLKKCIADKDAEIEQLKKAVEAEKMDSFLSFSDKTSMENKNKELQNYINQLEANQSLIQGDNPDLLALIFDETQTDRFAPDLAYSIKLWLDVYVNKPKVDSHNNKANTWIKNNTPYNGEQDDTPTRRVREIATPFKDLHISRKKLLENK